MYRLINAFHHHLPPRSCHLSLRLLPTWKRVIFFAFLIAHLATSIFICPAQLSQSAVTNLPPPSTKTLKTPPMPTAPSFIFIKPTAAALFTRWPRHSEHGAAFDFAASRWFISSRTYCFLHLRVRVCCMRDLFPYLPSHRRRRRISHIDLEKTQHCSNSTDKTNRQTATGMIDRNIILGVFLVNF